eukprot:NODE_14622_length_1097_cov_2.607216.p4 GENE.NODE_14622_length_1097_cov_2.607216~~NODE_14622_length_1097_cov_2.607216.p4  ORF type:complete len:101 (-),score=12.53 NODE_14622_length_1097_cov_2.607216:4-306(-)
MPSTGWQVPAHPLRMICWHEERPPPACGTSHHSRPATALISVKLTRRGRAADVMYTDGVKGLVPKVGATNSTSEGVGLALRISVARAASAARRHRDNGLA